MAQSLELKQEQTLLLAKPQVLLWEIFKAVLVVKNCYGQGLVTDLFCGLLTLNKTPVYSDNNKGQG